MHRTVPLARVSPLSRQTSTFQTPSGRRKSTVNLGLNRIVFESCSSGVPLVAGNPYADGYRRTTVADAEGRFQFNGSAARRSLLDLLNHLGVRFEIVEAMLRRHTSKRVFVPVVPILARTSPGLPKHTHNQFPKIRMYHSCTCNTSRQRSTAHIVSREWMEESLTGSASSLACPRQN